MTNSCRQDTNRNETDRSRINGIDTLKAKVELDAKFPTALQGDVKPRTELEGRSSSRAELHGDGSRIAPAELGHQFSLATRQGVS
jgi:hypothetical protein